jgi:hypothetical protein
LREKRRLKVFENRVFLRERDHLGYPSVDGRIILKWVCRK